MRLAVTGGTVVTPWGRRRADVLVAGERIAAIAAPGALAGSGEELDASGLLVLPGLVDAHVHVRDPGFPAKEDFGSAGRAAAAGGITTMIVMPHDEPVAASGALLREKAAIGEAASIVDFALLGAVGSANVDAIPGMAAAGAVAVEAWLDSSPPVLGPVGAWDLREIMRAARAAGVPVGVWGELESIGAGGAAALQAAGRRDAAAHGDSRPTVSEEIGAAMACALAAETGAALHLRQLSTAGALAAGLAARARGVNVSLEVTPHHVALTDRDAATAGGRLKVLPPLRPPEHGEALRAALARGEIDVVASDHAPHAPAEKAAGAEDVWAGPAGLPGLETLLPVLLSTLGPEAPEIIARVCAAAPAARFGLTERKGGIVPGRDADLVLVDPEASWTVDPARLQTRAADSPFAGRTLRGAVRQVLRRGETVFAAGAAAADCGHGAWLRRAAA